MQGGRVILIFIVVRFVRVVSQSSEDDRREAYSHRNHARPCHDPRSDVERRRGSTEKIIVFGFAKMIS